MTTKRCFKCLCEKPLDAFYKHAMMADKHLNKCKECTKKDVSEHRQANLEKVRAYDRMRASTPHRIEAKKRQLKTPSYALSKKKSVKKWQESYPERRMAHIAVGNALRVGKLTRHPCWVCGTKAVAHHPDYDRPLDVVWLCHQHHRQAHALVSNDSSIKESA